MTAVPIKGIMRVIRSLLQVKPASLMLAVLNCSTSVAEQITKTRSSPGQKHLWSGPRNECLTSALNSFRGTENQSGFHGVAEGMR